MHQDFLAAAEIDQVPDDEEVAGQVEFFDQRQLALDLAAGFFVIRAEALARAFIGSLAQKRVHGFSGSHGIFGKFVAQIGQCEIEARR